MSFFKGLSRGLQARSHFEEQKRSRRADEEYREWQKTMAEREFKLKERQIAAREAAAAKAQKDKERLRQNALNMSAAGLLGTSASMSTKSVEPVDTQMEAVTSGEEPGISYARDPREINLEGVTPAPSSGPEGRPYRETAAGWKLGQSRLGGYFQEVLPSFPEDKQSEYYGIMQTVLSDNKISAELMELVDSYEDAGIPLSPEEVMSRIQLTDTRLTPKQMARYKADIWAVKSSELLEEGISTEMYARAMAAESALNDEGYGLQLDFRVAGLPSLDPTERRQQAQFDATNWDTQTRSLLAQHYGAEPSDAAAGVRNLWDDFLTAPNETAADLIYSKMIEEQGANIANRLFSKNMFKRSDIMDNEGILLSWKEAIANSDEGVYIGKDPEVKTSNTLMEAMGLSSVPEEGKVNIPSDLGVLTSVFENGIVKDLQDEDGESIEDPEGVFKVNTSLPLEDIKVAESFINYLQNEKNADISFIAQSPDRDSYFRGWLLASPFTYINTSGEETMSGDHLFEALIEALSKKEW